MIERTARVSHICVACGTQYPSKNCPFHCPICEDERQYVPVAGQKWISLSELREKHQNIFFEEGEKLWGIHTQPQFAIGQRALLLQTSGGGIFWDCVSLVDQKTVEEVTRLGGLKAIAISHPHYYTSMVEWSRAFGGIPIYLHEDDKQWVQFPDPAIRFWGGESYAIAEGVTLLRLGAHFKGFQALHWTDGDGVLMTGDMPQVCPDRRYVSFMYSYPNFIPVKASIVRGVLRKLEPLKYARHYGAWPMFQVVGDPKEALRRSAERYLRAIGETEQLGDVSPHRNSKSEI
jgi:hypothetical protein